MNLINFDDLNFKGALGVAITYFASQAILDYSGDLDELDDQQVHQRIQDIGADVIDAVDQMLDEASSFEELEISPLVEIFEKHAESPEDAEYDAGSAVTAARQFGTEILAALFRHGPYADGDEALAVFAAEPVKSESADGELG